LTLVMLHSSASLARHFSSRPSVAQFLSLPSHNGTRLSSRLRTLPQCCGSLATPPRPGQRSPRPHPRTAPSDCGRVMRTHTVRQTLRNTAHASHGEDTPVPRLDVGAMRRSNCFWGRAGCASRLWQTIYASSRVLHNDTGQSEVAREKHQPAPIAV